MFKSLEKDVRNIVSIFGNISFKRRYYLDKQTNEKVYLLDKAIDIKANENLLLNVEERLINEAVVSSYEHAGETAAYNTKISRQEVKNKIKKNKYFRPVELAVLKYGNKEYRKFFKQLLDGKIAL